VATTSVAGVFVPVSQSASLGFSAEIGDLLKRYSQMVITEVGTDDPEGLGKYHILSDGDQDYAVEYVERLRPADKTILYFFGVKR
jgi:hypothetical protein